MLLLCVVVLFPDQFIFFSLLFNFGLISDLISNFSQVLPNNGFYLQ